MTLPHLHEFQLLMLRVYVRNAMFFATLPFYLAQESHPVPARRVCGSEERRWLR
jgi:hypothetical protein